MSTLIIFSLILLFIISLLAFNILLVPKMRLVEMKKLYGNKLHVIHHYGVGILKEYKQNLLQKQDSAQFLRNLSKENPSLQACGFNFGVKVGIMFFDPDLIKEVHIKHESFTKMESNPAIFYIFNSSILIERGDNWHKQRRFLGKTFHFDEIKKRIPEIKSITQQMLSNLESSGSQEIQVIKQCEKVTSEVVFKTFFGCSLENLTIQTPKGEVSIAHELVYIITDSYNLLQTSKYVLLKTLAFKFRASSIFPTKYEKELWTRLRNLKKKCNEIVVKRKNELREDISKANNTILDLYLKEIILNESSTITEEEIVGNFLVLFFGGTDTSANMVGAALYYLSLHSDAQTKARNEVMSLLAKSKNNSDDVNKLFEKIDFENISNFNYLQAVLKESLRIVPPGICVFLRKAIEDVKIGQYQLKKGDVANTHFLFNQSNPSVFENPDDFKPERWLTSSETVSSYNFTPFSVGPRNCIGQHLALIEGKIMLAYILLNYDILPNQNQSFSKEMYLVYHLTPDNLCYFKRRTNQS